MCTPEQRQGLAPSTLTEQSVLGRCSGCAERLASNDQGLEFLFYQEGPDPCWAMRRYHLVCFVQFLGCEITERTVGGPEQAPGTFVVHFSLTNVREHRAQELATTRQSLYESLCGPAPAGFFPEPRLDDAEDSAPEWLEETPVE